jgi:hypothetical protein
MASSQNSKLDCHEEDLATVMASTENRISKIHGPVPRTLDRARVRRALP